MAENNRDMAKQGMFSLEMLELMQRHIDEFRSEHVAADQPAPVDTEANTADAAADQPAAVENELTAADAAATDGR